MAEDAELPVGDGVTRFSFCPSHIALEDGVADLKGDVKALDQRLGALVTEVTKTQAQMGSLIDEMKKDREDRMKDRELMAQNMEFLQGLVTCNNKASMDEREELIKFGGKVVMILLAAVVGLKVVTSAMGIPFP